MIPKLTNVRRVLIVGCSGSGKSTLSRRLAAFLGLPFVPLDRHRWSSGWIAKPAEEWASRVTELAAEESWVIDGPDLPSLPVFLARAELIIHLDFHRVACLTGVIRRYFQYRGSPRPELPDGCPEGLSLEFTRWVWRYNEDVRPELLSLIANLPAMRFNSRRQLDAWLHNLGGKGIQT